MLISLPLYIFPLCMLAAAVTDAWKFIIPNIVSLVLIPAFIAAFAVSGLGFDVLLNHVVTGIGMLVLGMLLWHLGYAGGGDAKLLSAAALWLGWPVYGHALIFVSLFGGLMAIGFLVTRLLLRWFPRVSINIPFLAKIAATKDPKLPYGVAIAAGSLFVFPQSTLFLALIG